MILKINTSMIPFFTGTYQDWEVIETNEEGTEELEVDYKGKDLLKSIVEAYQDKEDYIKSELDLDFIKSLRFTGGYYIPREYNFSTDSIDLRLKIDNVKFAETLRKLNGDVKFNEYLNDNYSSRDGFVSFTPNNTKDLITEIATRGSEWEQAVCAVISYLSESKYSEIEDTVKEYWRGNGYMGLDYKVTEEENATA